MDPSTFLLTILHNVTSLIPIRVEMVYCFQQGVKFRFGKPINRCGHRTGARFWYPTLRRWKKIPYPCLRRTQKTGVHVYWAWVEDIEVWSTAELVMETHYQTVTTLDTQDITVSMSISYRIVNAKKTTVNVQDFKNSTENLAQGFLTDIIMQYTRDEFFEKVDEIAEEMVDKMNEKVYSDWGAKILAVNFVNTPKTRSLRLFGDEHPLDDE